MAIEGIYGTIGSGKSQLLNYRMVRKAIDGRELALNYEVNEQGLYLALRKYGQFTHNEAMSKIRNIIVIRTYEQLRGLKNRWLGFDEAHFWFFSRMWERVQLADVQFWSLSRKLGVDVCLVTQRWSAVDAVVRDLAQVIWSATPLVSKEVSVFPFDMILSVYNKTLAQLSTFPRFHGFFKYVKVNDVLGKTNRKDLTSAVGNASIVGLDLTYARCYDTGRFFTSPLIEEDARRQRVEYLKNVYFGHLLPLQTCSVCNGLGHVQSELRVSAEGLLEWVPVPDVLQFGDRLISHSDCPNCSGSGYFSAPTHDDVLEAHESARKGLLGNEAAFHWQQHFSGGSAAPGDNVPPPVKKGGWAARKAGK